MSKETFPAWYNLIKEKHGKFVKALEQLGETVRQEGPLDEKTMQLVQLAAAAAIRSEGRGAQPPAPGHASRRHPREISHTIILLTSTIGFPNTSTAMSWVYTALEKKRVVG